MSNCTGHILKIPHVVRDWHLFNWEDCRTCPEKDHCDAGCEKPARIPEDIFSATAKGCSGLIRRYPSQKRNFRILLEISGAY